MHSGGIADKVGNRYEARWTIHQLLGLLDGSISSIAIEALGGAEQGFEFSLVRNGTKEWHQCKRQTTAATWSINNLATAGVLSTFTRKLTSDVGRCVFVSSDNAKQIQLLQDKLPAASVLADFEASLSEAETQHWSVLQQRLGGSPLQAFAFLKSTEFRTISERDLAEVVQARLAFFFKGDPEYALAALRVWIEDDHNFNRPLTFDDLIEGAREKKLETKQYELDQFLPGRIRDATTSYTSSYPEQGAGLFRIDRPAAREVRSALDAGAPVVLVSGAAGVGKSAIIADVIEGLRADHELHLAFRVDRAGGVRSIEELGTQILGTADNPAIILERVAGKGRAVLIIDQADAVSEVSGRIAELRRVILDLVRKTAQYPRVQVVFSCRTFDLENDHQFGEIAGRLGAVRVEVKPFTPEEVDPVLAARGILYDRGNAKLMKMLCLPIGLTLAAQLSRSGVIDLRSVEHLSQLYDRLLAVRDQEVQRDFHSPWSVAAALGAIASDMSDRQHLACPKYVLDDYPGASDILQRVGLIVERDGRISFMHESLFDYLHARSFVQRRQELVPFLLEQEQTLFRRTQVRQILAFERDLNRKRYLTDLEAILLHRRVRPHIRDAVMKWLATLPDPTEGEWQLVARYAEAEGIRKIGLVIWERKPWFDLIRGLGVIDGWLESGEQDLDWVIGFLRSVAPAAPTEVAGVLDDFLDRHPERIRSAFGAFRWIDPKANATPLADCLIRALERGSPEDWQSDGTDWDDYYASWIKAAPNDAARIMGAQFRRWLRFHPTGHPFDRTDPGGSSIHWMTELMKAAPLAFLQELLPPMHEAMKRTAMSDSRPSEDEIWSWRSADHTDMKIVRLLDLVRSAFATVAMMDIGVTSVLLRSIEPDRFITSLHLLLETVAANPAELYPLLVEQMDNPGLFKAGWHMAPAWSAGRAIAACMPFFDDDLRNHAEAVVLALRPELQLASEMLIRNRSDEDWKRRFPDYSRWCLNNSGKRMWSVLRQIGVDKLSVRARAKLAELDRKFTKQSPEKPDGMHGGFVSSPISHDRTMHMDDRAWLKAISAYSNRDERHIWHRNGLRGGARELSHELGARTKEQPERFIALLPKLPNDARQCFADGIISGVAETNPSSDVVEQILAMSEKHPPAYPGTYTLVRLVRSASGRWGPRAEKKILEVALGSDDSTGVSSSSRPSKGEKEPDWKLALEKGGELELQALNSARGSALEQLGFLAWESKADFERYRHVIEAVVATKTEPHIHAALGMLLLSGLKHDPAAGTAWVVQAAKACPEAAFTHRGRHLAAWVGELDSNAFRQLVEIFLERGDPLGAAFASMVVFERCLDDHHWRDLCEQLISESEEYRAAAAAIAAIYFQEERAGALASEWLMRFFDDNSKMVRHEASDCFRRMKPGNIGEYANLFEAFAASRHFMGERTFFLHLLEKAPPTMADFALGLLEGIVTASRAEDRRTGAFDLYEVGDLVLKLYASNLDYPDRIRRSLDLIDQLIDAGYIQTKLEAA